MSKAAIAILLLLTPGLASAQTPPTLRPIDEGPRNPDFLAFRTSLLRTIERRDVPALLEVVHPDIKNTFGDDNGKEAFTRRWRLDRADSELWRELGSILSLGGAFQSRDVFVAPYVFSNWPEKLDSFEYVAVVGTSVRIRSAASTQARILATLSHSILELESGDQRETWTKVRLPGGRSGFVASRLVRSPVDYRAFFVRENGRWQLNTLVAGD